MMESMDRADALLAAATILGPGTSPAEVITTAEQFLPWLTFGPLTGRVADRTYKQGSAQHSPTVLTPGGAVQLKDDEQFTVTLEAEDSKGQDTTDAGIVWTEDSNGQVVTLQPSDDGMSCLVVAGLPGTANYKASDGTREFDGSAIVTAGDVTTLVGTEGQPEPQAPAAPTA